jgi:hypothetical protein
VEKNKIIGTCAECGAAIHTNDRYVQDELTGDLWCDMECMLKTGSNSNEPAPDAQQYSFID